MLPPTDIELDEALIRLMPYLNGYPVPMIDTRYLRVADAVATEQEERDVAAEMAIWRLFRQDAKQ